MPSRQKGIIIEEKEVYDIEAIFARVIGLLAVGQLTLESILKHELSAIPTALFKDDEDIRIDKNPNQCTNWSQIDLAILPRHPLWMAVQCFGYWIGLMTHQQRL